MGENDKKSPPSKKAKSLPEGVSSASGPTVTGSSTSTVNVIPGEDKGTALLHTLIGMIANGDAVKDEVIADLYRLLGSWQVRVDLTQVGLVTHSMSRLKRLNWMIGTLEESLLGDEKSTEDEIRAKLFLLGEENQIKLLKILLGDKQVHTTFLTDRARTPTVSAPDNMMGSLASDVDEAKKTTAAATTHHLSVESRRRVAKMLEQMRGVVHEAEVVKTETVPVKEPLTETAAEQKSTS